MPANKKNKKSSFSGSWEGKEEEEEGFRRRRRFAYDPLLRGKRSLRKTRGALPPSNIQTGEVLSSPIILSRNDRAQKLSSAQRRG